MEHKEERFQQILKENEEVRAYVERVGKMETLSREEQERLGRAARAGDEDAREQLIRAKLYMAAELALQHEQADKFPLELIDAANVALERAVARFDWDIGLDFENYMKWKMGQHVNIRARRLTREHVVKVCFPTVSELAAAFGENDLAREYLKEIGHLEILSEEQEQTLARQMLQGDEAAREQLVEHNLLRVVFIVREYLGRGMCSLDLLEEGNKGLMEAAKEYKEPDKYPFFAFAAWYIREAIQDALRHCILETRIPEALLRHDDPACLKDPRIFRKYLDERRGGNISDEDWNVIAFRLGYNGGRALSVQEVCDMTGFSLSRVHWNEDRVVRRMRTRRRKHIRDFYADEDPKNPEDQEEKN